MDWDNYASLFRVIVEFFLFCEKYKTKELNFMSGNLGVQEVAHLWVNLAVYVLDKFVVPPVKKYLVTCRYSLQLLYRYFKVTMLY